LPPQLLFETLCSIYDVLFPTVGDSKSKKFVSRLISESHFDPDLERFDGRIRETPRDFKYNYWGDRLDAIYDQIVVKRPPRNSLISWFDRHTTDRNAFNVAILGLFLAVFFGMLGSAIGAAQLAVSILAWKRPVQLPGGNGQCRD
jgi:hypothetical protein